VTTRRGLYWEDFAIGATLRTPARTITATDIVNFACLSGDFNEVHTNWEFCKSTPFGEPIAHGPLVYAIMGGLQIRQRHQRRDHARPAAGRQMADAAAGEARRHASPGGHRAGEGRRVEQGRTAARSSSSAASSATTGAVVQEMETTLL